MKKKKCVARWMGYCPTVLQGGIVMLQYNKCIASWEGWFRLENVLQYSGLYCIGGRKCIAGWFGFG